MTPHLLLLSGSTAAERETAEQVLAGELLDHPDADLGAVTRGLARRPAGRYRTALVAATAEEAASHLLDPGPADVHRDEVCGDVSLVLLLPGVGEQYPGMVAEVHRGLPPFAAAFDRCAAVGEREAGIDIRPAADPSPAAGTGRIDLRALLGQAPAGDALADTRVAQLVTFAVSAGLVSVLDHCGVSAAAMLGYSVGEYAAAWAAGVFDLAAATRLVARRAELIAGTPPGAMLAVTLPAERLAELIAEIPDPNLVVAAADGPRLSIASGPAEAVARLQDLALRGGTPAARLPVRHAFHSPLLRHLEPALAALTRAARPRPPRTRLLSNLTGTWMSADDAVDGTHWARHASHPVRFADNLARLWTLPRPVVLELGPGGTLGTLATTHPSAQPGRPVLSALPARSQTGSGLRQLLTAIGRAWAAGVDLRRAALADLRPAAEPAHP